MGKLTKREIQKIKTAYKKAIEAEIKLKDSIYNLNTIVSESLQIECNTDILSGDGIGITANEVTHITIEKLIELAVDGVDITKDVIDDNSFF